MNQDRPEKQINIVIDAMGGDFAPENEVKGAIEYLKDPLPGANVHIYLSGKEDILKSVLKEQDYSSPNIHIIHAEDVVTMNDEASAAIKKKRDSSLYKGMEFLKEGKADAIICAGNTGATLSTATVLLGRIQGASRPTIGTMIPTISNKPALMLDAGATLDHLSRFLFEFSVMGSIYVEYVLNVKNPRIGLLNVGEEKSKGTKEVQATYKLLQESNLNFIGNIEGRDILQDKADVVVCDGFTGNIILKLAESFPGFLKHKLIEYSKQGFINKLKAALIATTLRKIFKQFDYQEYGGVPLLGVNGVVIIGHGKSTPLAIKNMIKRGTEMVQLSLINKIEEALKKNKLEQNDQ